MVHGWRTPPILGKPMTDAAAVLSGYFEQRADGTGVVSSGAMFERFGGGGDNDATRDRVTVEDLVAVSMLEVHIPGSAALRILGPDAAEISAYLAKIPTNVDLAGADDGLILQDSDAWTLWDFIRGYPGMGRTTTSKLLARKRPRLLPVQDTHVLNAVGHPDNFWPALREFLRQDRSAWSSWLREVRSLSAVGDDISELRVFDVLVWSEESERSRLARKLEASVAE